MIRIGGRAHNSPALPLHTFWKELGNRAIETPLWPTYARNGQQKQLCEGV